MILDAVILLVGLALLLAAGDILVRGASTLARRLGVSPLVIGLTVVAFGTSAPELAVNVLAALEGSTALSFGNIVGSNIANIALILGCAALIRPLAVQGSVIVREIPMMLLATAAFLIMEFDRLRGAAEEFDRSDGLLLLLLFGVFLYYTVAEVVRMRGKDPLATQMTEAGTPGRGRSILLSALLVAGGLAGLIGGARLTVSGAVAIAQALAVPRVVISLTVVAPGTSLPELATSVMAAMRGHADLAVGNVVGSNIFNVLFIMGVTAMIRPVAVPTMGQVDLLVMTAVSVVFLPLAVTGGRRIVRSEGAFLVVLYVGFVVWSAFLR